MYTAETTTGIQLTNRDENAPGSFITFKTAEGSLKTFNRRSQLEDN